MSNSGMVPCNNPTLCGVQSHRRGTVAKCMSQSAMKNPSSRLGSPTLASSEGDTIHHTLDDREMQARSIDRNHNPSISLALANYAYSRRDGSTGSQAGKAYGRTIITNLADNPATSPEALHLIATGGSLSEREGKVRPDGDSTLEAVIRHPKVDDHTLRIIAKTGSPNVSKLAKERIDARTGFFRKMLNRLR